MKIRVAIIDDDESYVKRLVGNLQVNYAEKIEAYFFSNFERFLDFYENNMVQAILVSESFLGSEILLPKNVLFAWLVSDSAVQELSGIPAIAKFQKVELFYKRILNLYADMEDKLVLKSNGRKKCVVFTSAQGGAGVSSVTAAYALNRARAGLKVFYVNLDTLNSPRLFFQADGNFGFSEVLYALKVKKGNLVLKLESLAKRDKQSVRFFDACKNANDMLEIKPEDIGLLFDTLRSMDGIDVIAVDLPLDFSPCYSLVMEKYADTIIFLNDGSMAGNEKLKKAMEMFKNQGKSTRNLFAKSALLYNKFDKTAAAGTGGSGIEPIGGIHDFGAVTQEQAFQKLAEHPAISKIR